jgi:hypothetical protein
VFDEAWGKDIMAPTNKDYMIFNNYYTISKRTISEFLKLLKIILKPFKTVLTKFNALSLEKNRL